MMHILSPFGWYLVGLFLYTVANGYLASKLSESKFLFVIVMMLNYISGFFIGALWEVITKTWQ